METGHATEYFLGSNSERGFFSLYSDMADTSAGDFIWLIKGGPGCGKSSFMRKIGAAAESAGFSVEYTRCSGDPDSLDAVYIPEKKLCYADATSPHCMDAALPACSESYLDLGAFYRTDKLRQRRGELAAMNARYKEIYARIYGLIAAAGKLEPYGIPELIGERERAYVCRRAQGVAEREFGRGGGKRLGRQKHRFISAISCRGCLRLDATVASVCQRVYALDNEYGLADSYLQTLADAARQRGIDAVLCHSPLHPERLEALLIPELSLGFVSGGTMFGEVRGAARNVRLDAVPQKEKLQRLRKKIRSSVKLRDAVLREALSALSEAKQLHDEIESVYNPHVDFDGVYSLCDLHIKNMLRI